jgi:hypothetical protein
MRATVQSTGPMRLRSANQTRQGGAASDSVNCVKRRSGVDFMHAPSFSARQAAGFDDLVCLFQSASSAMRAQGFQDITSDFILIVSRRADQLHTRRAVFATSFSLVHRSSSVRRFPSGVDAVPHCELSVNLSSVKYFADS